ncbi:MAG: pantoate--beta-alanine ligase [Polyangiaceae bacterium]|nr:pantoate--beta-alanine ligase [Polyangiaceae bacterium]
MPAIVCRSVEEFRRRCDDARRDGGTLALVPTMGALHAGHCALMKEAHNHGSTVAVTIFVNPTQFAPGEDLSAYPRQLETDVAACEDEKVALVFAPAEGEMYVEGESTRVAVAGITEGLCGASRPEHFEGVTTIVTKLLAIAGPCTAIFGRKDYQQLKVIERMVADLLLAVRVVGFAIVREADGMALSSRNRYLSADERTRALGIARGLSAAVRSFETGERRQDVLVGLLRAELQNAGMRQDYVSVAHPDRLTAFPEGEVLPDRALLAVAAFMGKTRLIDNVVLGEDSAPLE